MKAKNILEPQIDNSTYPSAPKVPANTTAAEFLAANNAWTGMKDMYQTIRNIKFIRISMQRICREASLIMRPSLRNVWVYEAFVLFTNDASCASYTFRVLEMSIELKLNNICILLK